MESQSKQPGPVWVVVSRMLWWALGAWAGFALFGALMGYLSGRGFLWPHAREDLAGRLEAALSMLILGLAAGAVFFAPGGLVVGLLHGLMRLWRRSIDIRQAPEREEGERRWLIVTGGLRWALIFGAVTAGSLLVAGAVLGSDLRRSGPGDPREGLLQRLQAGAEAAVSPAVLGMGALGFGFGLVRGTTLARRRGGDTKPSRLWGFVVASVGWLLVLAAIGGVGTVLREQLFLTHRGEIHRQDEDGRTVVEPIPAPSDARTRGVEIVTGLAWYPLAWTFFLAWPAALVLGLVQTLYWPVKSAGQAPTLSTPT